MKFWTRGLTLMTLLALTATSFAQEAETAEVPVPQGLGLLMILIGVTAVLIVGVVMARRESGDDENLV